MRELARRTPQTDIKKRAGFLPSIAVIIDLCISDQLTRADGCALRRADAVRQSVNPHTPGSADDWVDRVSSAVNASSQSPS